MLVVPRPGRSRGIGERPRPHSPGLRDDTPRASVRRRTRDSIALTVEICPCIAMVEIRNRPDRAKSVSIRFRRRRRAEAQWSLRSCRGLEDEIRHSPSFVFLRPRRSPDLVGESLFRHPTRSRCSGTRTSPRHRDRPARDPAAGARKQSTIVARASFLRTIQAVETCRLAARVEALRAQVLRAPERVPGVV